MSGIGGKADIAGQPLECPLLATSGSQAWTADREELTQYHFSMGTPIKPPHSSQEPS